MRALSLVCLVAACAAGPVEVPAPGPAAPPEPAAARGAEAEPSLPDETAPDPEASDEYSDGEFRPEDATAGRWYEPLSPASQDPISAEEKAAQQACVERHRLLADDATDVELLAGAKCMGEDHGVGKMIRIAMTLVDRFPESSLVPDALILMGRGFERAGRLPDAIERYQSLLRRYPNHELARVVGQRAVCLARAVPLPERERELLVQLERLYGRKGFETPDPERLGISCGE